MIFTQTQAFVYKWMHLPTLRWYIGSRTAQGCCPADGYICSSRLVRPLVESAESEWIRTVVATGDPKDMLELETVILELFDAKNDPRSYNQHNGDGRFTTLGVEPHNKGKYIPRNKPAWNSGKKAPQISAGKKGKPAKNKGVPMSEEQRLKMVEIHNNRSEETCQRISDALKGKKQSIESSQKKSAKLKGRKQSPEHIARRVASRMAKTKGS